MSGCTPVHAILSSYVSMNWKRSSKKRRSAAEHLTNPLCETVSVWVFVGYSPCDERVPNRNGIMQVV